MIFSQDHEGISQENGEKRNIKRKEQAREKRTRKCVFFFSLACSFLLVFLWFHEIQQKILAEVIVFSQDRADQNSASEKRVRKDHTLSVLFPLLVLFFWFLEEIKQKIHSSDYLMFVEYEKLSVILLFGSQ